MIDSIENKIANELRQVNRELPGSALKLSELYNHLLKYISQLEMDNYQMAIIADRYKKGYEIALTNEAMLRDLYTSEIDPNSQLNKLKKNIRNDKP